MQVQHIRDSVRGSPRVELIKKPESALSERQRRLLRFFVLQFGSLLLGSGIDPPRHARDGWGLNKGTECDRPLESFRQTGNHTDCGKGIPANFEKLRFGIDVAHPEHVTPNCRDLLLSLAGRGPNNLSRLLAHHSFV